MVIVPRVYMICTISLAFLLIALGTPTVRAQSVDTVLAWPRTSDDPRVRYVETIASLNDVKPDKGFFPKLFTALFGKDEELTWLVQPVGIAVTPDGVLYVADPGAKGVHVLDRKRKTYRLLTAAGRHAFVSPVGVVSAPGGMVYISDSERAEVFVLDGDDDLMFSIKSPLVRPTGLFVQRDTLYVVDTGLHKIFLFDRRGKRVSEFGTRGAGEGEFNFPVSLTGSGRSWYVLDALNYRVQRFDNNRKFGSAFGSLGNSAGSFASPKSVALDSQGHVYVTDALMDNFQIFDSSGQLLLVVGQNGEGPGQFSSPGGIAVDASDRIYVVESLNRRIQVFQYLGKK